MGNALSRTLARYSLPPYTSKEQAEASEENQIELSRLLKVALASALGFYVVGKASTYLFKDSAFFQRLSLVKQRRFPTYMTSFVHAAVATAFAVYKHTQHDAANVTGNRRMLAFALGYFVNDIVATMPDWVSHPQDLLHHVCGIGVIFGAMMRRSVTEYVPRFLILESSTVFLDIMWVLKESGMANTAVYTASSGLFASLFFATRVVWMPYGLLEIANNHERKWKGLGPFRFGLAPLCALQYYWFYRIILMLTRK